MMVACDNPEEDTKVTVTDIDGNVYKTIQIGDQLWMAKNLKVTKYQDGSDIPHLRDDEDWTGTTFGAYSINKDNSSNELDIYGLFYNGYAATDSPSIAPTGWHIPTDDEWQVLVDYLGVDAGGKMKEVGTTHWLEPNTGATNESGFTALAGGYRNDFNGNTYFTGNYVHYWSKTVHDHNGGWSRVLFNQTSDVDRKYLGLNHGFYIRCLKD